MPSSSCSEAKTYRKTAAAPDAPAARPAAKVLAELEAEYAAPTEDTLENLKAAFADLDEAAHEVGHQAVVDPERALEGAAPTGGAAVDRLRHLVDVLVGQLPGPAEPGAKQAGEGEVAPVDLEDELGPVARDVPGVAAHLVDLARGDAAATLCARRAVGVEKRLVVGVVQDRGERAQEPFGLVVDRRILDVVEGGRAGLGRALRLEERFSEAAEELRIAIDLAETGGKKLLNGMRNLLKEWGWGQAKLETLDQRRQWKIKRVLEERTMLVAELTRSYRALSQFAREHDSQLAIRSSDLNLLGRKLYVAFERKAGKVDIINPGISRDLSEERLSLHYVEEQAQPGWALYRGSVMYRHTGEHAPLKRSASLLQLLAWCHFNGLVNRNVSSLSIQPPECGLSHWELRCVLECLQQLFPNGGRPQTDIQSLAGPATIRRAGLFVNIARDSM